MVGHSYVRRLKEYRENGHVPGKNEKIVSVDGVTMALSYVYRGGRGYEYFNSSDQHKVDIIESKPDIILVILGGNGVSSGKGIPLVSAEMRKFHVWLREACPGAITIAAECEPRYDLNPHDTGDDVQESHWERRNAFNLAVGRMLKKGKCDYVLRIAKYLNCRKFYDKLGVHLNNRGNRFYWGLVKETLAGAVEKYRLGNRD